MIAEYAHLLRMYITMHPFHMRNAAFQRAVTDASQRGVPQQRLDALKREVQRLVYLSNGPSMPENQRFTQRRQRPQTPQRQDILAMYQRVVGALTQRGISADNEMQVTGSIKEAALAAGRAEHFMNRNDMESAGKALELAWKNIVKSDDERRQYSEFLREESNRVEALRQRALNAEKLADNLDTSVRDQMNTLKLRWNEENKIFVNLTGGDDFYTIASVLGRTREVERSVLNLQDIAHNAERVVDRSQERKVDMGYTPESLDRLAETIQGSTLSNRRKQHYLTNLAQVRGLMVQGNRRLANKVADHFTEAVAAAMFAAGPQRRRGAADGKERELKEHSDPSGDSDSESGLDGKRVAPGRPQGDDAPATRGDVKQSVADALRDHLAAGSASGGEAPVTRADVKDIVTDALHNHARMQDMKDILSGVDTTKMVTPKDWTAVQYGTPDRTFMAGPAMKGENGSALYKVDIPTGHAIAGPGCARSTEYLSSIVHGLDFNSLLRLREVLASSLQQQSTRLSVHYYDRTGSSVGTMASHLRMFIESAMGIEDDQLPWPRNMPRQAHCKNILGLWRDKPLTFPMEEFCNVVIPIHSSMRRTTKHSVRNLLGSFWDDFVRYRTDWLQHGRTKINLWIVCFTDMNAVTTETSYNIHTEVQNDPVWQIDTFKRKVTYTVVTGRADGPRGHNDILVNPPPNWGEYPVPLGYWRNPQEIPTQPLVSRSARVWARGLATAVLAEGVAVTAETYAAYDAWISWGNGLYFTYKNLLRIFNGLANMERHGGPMAESVVPAL